MHGTRMAQYLFLSCVVLISLASCQGDSLGLNVKISRLEKLMVNLTKGFHEMRKECGKYITSGKKCSDALSFGKNISEYAKFNGSGVADAGLDAITSCFWIKAQKNSEEPAVLSYAVPRRDNEFLIYLVSNLVIVLFINGGASKGASLDTGVGVSDGKWHHVCITWKSSDGGVEAYKDGVCKSRKTGVVAGQRIAPSGIWIIGQDQDTCGGRFELRNAFRGSLTEVNVWNRVLDASEISTLASGKCGLGMQGNYIAYNDFVPQGAVRKFKPSCCN